MKRRNFIGVCVAGLLAPLSTFRASIPKSKKEVTTHASLIKEACEDIGISEESIDHVVKQAGDPKWDIVGRAMKVLEEGFKEKQGGRVISEPKILHASPVKTDKSNKNMDDFSCCVQSWKISEDLGREELFELGREGPYYKYVSFPVEIKEDITLEGVDCSQFIPNGITHYGEWVPVEGRHSPTAKDLEQGLDLPEGSLSDEQS